MAKKKAKPKTVTKRVGKKRRVEMMLRRSTVQKLSLEFGHSDSEIADLLSIDPKTVKNDLEKLRDNWKLLAARDFDEHISEQLAKLDHLEFVTWKAYERSIGTLGQTTTKTVTPKGNGKSKNKPEPEQIEVSTVEKQGIGDPRYLEQVRKIIETRIRLLGLDERSQEDGMVDSVPIMGVIVESKEDVQRMTYAQDFIADNEIVIEGEVINKE